MILDHIFSDLENKQGDSSGPTLAFVDLDIRSSPILQRCCASSATLQLLKQNLADSESSEIIVNKS